MLEILCKNCVLRALVRPQWLWCKVYKAPRAIITWQADSNAYLYPFDKDMQCVLVTDAAEHWSQRSHMTFWIVFFQSKSIISLMIATNVTPGFLIEPWVVAACLLQSRLPQTSGVCMWMRQDLNCMSVHVRMKRQECGLSCLGVCLTKLRLMLISKPNCCMTNLLFGCRRDSLLLNRMNHHLDVGFILA